MQPVMSINRNPQNPYPNMPQEGSQQPPSNRLHERVGFEERVATPQKSHASGRVPVGNEIPSKKPATPLPPTSGEECRCDRLSSSGRIPVTGIYCAKQFVYNRFFKGNSNPEEEV